VLLDIMNNPSREGLQPSGSRDSVERVLRLLRDEAGTDTDRFKANIETWFNDSMERVSGWYKRRTQLLLLFWGAFVTIGTNAERCHCQGPLERPGTSQAVVARAEQMRRSSRA
jgi:hypothetical protein